MLTRDALIYALDRIDMLHAVWGDAEPAAQVEAYGVILDGLGFTRELTDTFVDWLAMHDVPPYEEGMIYLGFLIGLLANDFAQDG